MSTPEHVPDPFVAALNAASPDSYKGGLSAVLDSADRTFAGLADTQATLPGEDYPSVALTRSQEHSGDHLPTLAHFKDDDPGREDPLVALVGITGYPAAVCEKATVVDAMFPAPFISVKWLGCASLQAARDYVNSAGGRITLPGAGDDDYTEHLRTAYANPHYVAPKPAQ